MGIGNRDLRAEEERMESSGVEIRHLRAFRTLSQDLHFTHAAERLHVAQQTMSRYIQQLETHLGEQLFERNTRQVELTARGREFAEELDPVLQSLFRIVSSRPGPTEAGDQVTLAYVTSSDDHILPDLINILATRDPGLRILTYECWSLEATRAVLDGRVDAALAFCPVLADELESIIVGMAPLGVVVADRPPWSGRESIEVSDLEDQTLALVSERIAPGFFERALAALPRRAGVYELEHSTRSSFLGDEHCRGEILAGRAFFATVSMAALPIPQGFLWRPIRPFVNVPVELVHYPPREGSALSRLISGAEALRASSSIARELLQEAQ
jgi:DNA-binding transcriptional LysR family regulator